MLTRTRDDEQIIERVAALDIGKAELMCCARVPDEDHPGRRLQEVASYSTMARSLLGMSDRLACLGVTRVYWPTWAPGTRPTRSRRTRPSSSARSGSIPGTGLRSGSS